METLSHLEEYFEPVTPFITPDLAQAVVDLKPDPRAVARVEELGRRADAGILTEVEIEEYKAYVNVGNLISLIKSRARQFLAEHSLAEHGG